MRGLKKISRSSPLWPLPEKQGHVSSLALSTWSCRRWTLPTDGMIYTRDLLPSGPWLTASASTTSLGLYVIALVLPVVEGVEDGDVTALITGIHACLEMYEPSKNNQTWPGRALLNQTSPWLLNLGDTEFESEVWSLGFQQILNRLASTKAVPHKARINAC